MKLEYNGDGEHITGVPARDLTQDDIDRLLESGFFNSKKEATEVLTSRGLYRVVKTRKSKSKDNKTTEDDD